MIPSIRYSLVVPWLRLFQLRQRRFGDQGQDTFDQREDHLCR